MVLISFPVLGRGGREGEGETVRFSACEKEPADLHLSTNEVLCHAG